MKKLKIGILGCASIAEKYIIPAIQELALYFEIVGVASRTSNKAEAFAQKFAIPPFSSYENLLNLPNLQAIYIPLPNSMHAEWVEKALNKGLHVLVEKSLACHYFEVEKLNRLAESKNLVLVENFQFRMHSQLQFILSLIEQGNIGQLRCIRSSFGFPPFPDLHNIRYNKALGGGSLFDAGAYPVKIAQLFLGNDISVKAANLYFDADKGVDTWGGAYLAQNNGSLFAEIAFGFDHYYQCNIELWGSKGRIYTNRIFTAPPEYKPEILLETIGSTKSLTLEPDHHFKNMLFHFYNLIYTKKGLELEYIQNINQARLLHELKNKADGK